MAGEVFRGGMNHDVGAQIERLLQVWRDEGVVDDHDGAVLVRELAALFEVDDVKHGVRHRLRHDEGGAALFELGLQRVGVGHVHHDDLGVKQPGQVLADEEVGPDVEVLVADYPVAVLEQSQHGQGDGCHAARGDERVLGVLQGRDVAAERVARGVAVALIGGARGDRGIYRHSGAVGVVADLYRARREIHAFKLGVSVEYAHPVDSGHQVLASSHN